MFGSAWVGSLFTHLLVLMVLSSAAASTQTTILPTARTTLSMAVYKAIPDAFGRMHRRYLTPTVSTVAMGGVSILLYIGLVYLPRTWGDTHASLYVIADTVTALGIWIAFYYGLTGFSCAWYYRRTLLRRWRDFWMQGVIPVLGGVILWFAGGWSIWEDWDVNAPSQFTAYTSWKMPFYPHWVIGGTFLIAFLALVVGIVAMIAWRFARPAFFRGQTLSRGTPTLVPDDGALPEVSSPGLS